MFPFFSSPLQLQHCLPVYLLLPRAHSQSSGGTQHHEPPPAPHHKLIGPAPPGCPWAFFPWTEGCTQEPFWQSKAAPKPFICFHFLLNFPFFPLCLKLLQCTKQRYNFSQVLPQSLNLLGYSSWQCIHSNPNVMVNAGILPLSLLLILLQLFTWVEQLGLTFGNMWRFLSFSKSTLKPAVAFRHNHMHAVNSSQKRQTNKSE